MKRIQKGPVRGISLKLQEEERERRMDFVPEVSAVDTEVIEIDTDTRDMLKVLNLNKLPGLLVQTQEPPARRPYGNRPFGAGAGAGGAGAGGFGADRR